MLKENQFLVINCCRKNVISNQREIANEVKLSLGNVNSTVKECRENGWITDDYDITQEGLKQLEPYRVSNAIIMAAGMSSRFAPISYECPKGLLVVRDEVLIERQIEQLQEAGITNITVVVGYMKEKFFYLERKYGVQIVVNEDYYRYNNTSTLIRVTEKLGNTYICSSDNYFTENVFDCYEYKPYFAAEYTDHDTEEYCLTTNKSGVITKVTISGPADSWYMIGHVYFTKELSQKFVEILKDEYYSEPSIRQLLWEQLYMKHIKELKVYIRKYYDGVIQEFDALDELRVFDEKYINNTNSSILQNICEYLHCQEKDIIGIKAIKKGLTNTSFKFEYDGKKYVYRYPGMGTKEYINRKSEAYSMNVAKKLGLDDTYIYMDADDGWKLSYYIDDARNLNYNNKREVKKALAMIRKLHDAKIKSDCDVNVKIKTQKLIEKIAVTGRNVFSDFEDLYNMIERLYDYTERDNVEKCLCHCDCCDVNFLVDLNGKLNLIDWEYSGNDDPANDLGSFICCSDYTMDEADEVLEMYFDRELTPQEYRHFIAYVAIASFYWLVWAIYQETRGNTVGESVHKWYKCCFAYGEKALELYKN